MDIKHALAQLRAEYAHLDRAIKRLEEIAGQPPRPYVARIVVKRRGRPPGSKKRV